MTAFDLVRKRKNLSLEETLIEGVERAIAQTPGINSFSAYVERLLAAKLMAENLIPLNYQLPGETRGGDRSQSKEEATDDEK